MGPSAHAIRVAEVILGPETADVEHCLSALRAAHSTLGREMSALIGPQGFDATFARAVRKSRWAHADLHRGGSEGAAGLPERLWASLRAREPAEVRMIGATILAAFYDLMSTFVGTELTQRLFQNAWPDRALSAPEPPENP